MEHCAISKDLLTTPLTTKISATFFRSKQVIGLLMICSETRIGPIFQSPWHRLEITLLSTVFYSFQWNYFFYVFWFFVESADACFLSFFSSYCWLLQHKIKLIRWTNIIHCVIYMGISHFALICCAFMKTLKNLPNRPLTLVVDWHKIIHLCVLICITEASGFLLGPLETKDEEIALTNWLWTQKS